LPYRSDYATTEPGRTDLDALAGITVLEFGAPWCGHCITAQPAIASLLSTQPQVRHLKIEDGRGRPLGRTFRVKLWPTVIFLRDGIERARVVRPVDTEPLRHALAEAIDDHDGSSGPDTHDSPRR